MSAQITDRLDNPDNVEIIRDQIGGIIAIEMDNQYQLALQENDPVADDYLATVLIENDEPFNAGGDNNLFPLINVDIERTQHASRDASTSVNYNKMQATFNVDCYQTGNYEGKFAGRTAAIKAWKLARCVRAILDSDVYTYLNLRGVVCAVNVSGMQSGVPSMSDSAVKVVVVRLTVDVTYDQDAPQTSGPGMEIMSVVISDDNGQIIADIS